MLTVQLLLIVLAVVIAAVYFIFRVKRRELYKLADELPGPEDWPFIGILYEFLGVKSEDIYKTLARLLNGTEESFRIWAGPILIYVVRNPDDLETVLKSEKCFEKHEIYDNISLPRGLFTIGGETYKIHRRILTPAFSLKRLQSYIPLIDEQSKAFVAKMRLVSECKQFDISEHVAEFNLKNILATLFGMKELPEKFVDAYLKDSIKMFKVVNERMCKVWLTFDFIFKLSSLYQSIAKNHRFERRNTLSDEIMKVKEITYKEKTNNDLQRNAVDLLYQIRGQVTYEEIKSEVDSVLVAGYDTTATTLSNILLMLAIHQDVQAKVVSELKEVFSSSTDEITEASLTKLKYLEMVIKECLRLFPLPSISVRKVTKDLKLSKNLIPAGTSILFETLYFQTSERFWGADAKQFNPDRFLPENMIKVHPYAFIPFAQGPRKCIGYKYAWVVMKIFLSNVLRNFHLTTCVKYEEIYLQMEFLLKIKPGYFVALERKEF